MTIHGHQQHGAHAPSHAAPPTHAPPAQTAAQPAAQSAVNANASATARQEAQYDLSVPAQVTALIQGSPQVGPGLQQDASPDTYYDANRCVGGSLFNSMLLAHHFVQAADAIQAAIPRTPNILGVLPGLPAAITALRSGHITISQALL